MARKAKAVEVEEVETEEEVQSSRSLMVIHEAMAEWLEGEGYITADSTVPEIIAAAFAKRTKWRKTEEYLDLRAEYEEGAAERKAAAAEKKAARAAAVVVEDDEEEVAPKPKRGAKKAAAAEATPKKAKRGKKAKDADENPFD